MNKNILNKFMNKAIGIATSGIKDGQSPFGACIVKNGKIISQAHNEVWKNTDITAHAEIIAIRKACKKLKTIDLSNCTIFTTTEPCPMCFSAIHWAKIDKIYFGTRISDAQSSGFSELTISNLEMKRKGKSKVKIKPDFMKAACRELFTMFKNSKNYKIY